MTAKLRERHELFSSSSIFFDVIPNLSLLTLYIISLPFCFPLSSCICLRCSQSNIIFHLIWCCNPSHSSDYLLFSMFLFLFFFLRSLLILSLLMHRTSIKSEKNLNPRLKIFFRIFISSKVVHTSF